MLTVDKIVPPKLIDMLLELHRKERYWTVMKTIDPTTGRYRCFSKYNTPENWNKGQEMLGMQALSLWLGDGPKIFKPTLEQCAALENIEVSLTVADYSQPYPTLLVLVDIPPFTSVLCHHWPEEQVITFSLGTPKHDGDIITTIRNVSSNNIEEAINTFDPDCVTTVEAAVKVQRIAANSCLALTNFANYLSYLYPHDVERDKRLGREQNERGERARKRLSLAIQQVCFEQSVKLHNTSAPAEGEDGEPTPSGRKMPCHWRRGHWRMQAHGPNHSLRKKMLIKPMMIHADLFVGERSNTTTIYKG